jgi:hypothetical protein
VCDLLRGGVIADLTENVIESAFSGWQAGPATGIVYPAKRDEI